MTTTFGWLLDAVPRTSLQVEFTTGRHEVADYAVVLLIGEEGEEQTVRVYDGSHGVNELHRYNRRGQKQSAEVFHPGTLGGGNALCDQADRGWLRGDDRVMAEDLRDLPARTPAQRIAHEAVELAIEGRSPYPANSVFIDAEETWTGREIKKAVDEGRAVVLVYPDSSTRILRAEVAAS